MNKDPYQIIKHKHVTEKATILGSLHSAETNVCVQRCETPKYLFIVDTQANKAEIAWAIEEIYSDLKVKVTKVNTLNMKPKPRKYRGKKGRSSAFKKAIVSLEKGDSIEDL